MKGVSTHARQRIDERSSGSFANTNNRQLSKIVVKNGYTPEAYKKLYGVTPLFKYLENKRKNDKNRFYIFKGDVYIFNGASDTLITYYQLNGKYRFEFYNNETFNEYKIKQLRETRNDISKHHKFKCKLDGKYKLLLRCGGELLDTEKTFDDLKDLYTYLELRLKKEDYKEEYDNFFKNEDNKKFRKKYPTLIDYLVKNEYLGILPNAKYKGIQIEKVKYNDK